jgi:hypothetical protein
MVERIREQTDLTEDQLARITELVVSPYKHSNRAGDKTKKKERVCTEHLLKFYLNYWKLNIPKDRTRYICEAYCQRICSRRTRASLCIKYCIYYLHLRIKPPFYYLGISQLLKSE